ncbi:SLAP domain-containing protein [Lactobacillus kitasatonis]|uniref:SLAP domain-containing protein n=1 Tax=Lactobacillus kitasatonis TaxID=237446 RepID=A0ABS1LUQ7_9LACO|nr:SLAP domain-containing protein [Lactobacillus kitasatonis]MBL1071926.1 SLAP domain-containing protein [Lactobacillus kitasatonis]
MKKNFIKHSSVVVAALLAAASVGAATGTVKADTPNAVTEYNNVTANGKATTKTIDTTNVTANGKAATKTIDIDTTNVTLSNGKQSATVTKPETNQNTSSNQKADSNDKTNAGNAGSNTDAGSTTTTTGSTTTTGTTTNNNGTQNTTNSNNTTANNNSSANNSSTSTSQQPADNNSNSTTETTSTSTTSAAKPVVRIAQRSYVYTKSGKIARKNGKRVVLKKSSTRSLSNAKLVTIKGQKYYQIGKNQYVKASNVIAPIRKANVRAVVKGRKNARVRAYTSTGKRTRSYLSGRKSYKFTARRSINGRTYYKVSGKNLWIPASKLNIR